MLAPLQLGQVALESLQLRERSPIACRQQAVPEALRLARASVCDVDRDVGRAALAGDELDAGGLDGGMSVEAIAGRQYAIRLMIEDVQNYAAVRGAEHEPRCCVRADRGVDSRGGRSDAPC